MMQNITKFRQQMLEIIMIGVGFSNVLMPIFNGPSKCLVKLWESYAVAFAVTRSQPK